MRRTNTKPFRLRALLYLLSVCHSVFYREKEQSGANWAITAARKIERSILPELGRWPPILRHCRPISGWNQMTFEMNAGRLSLLWAMRPIIPTNCPTFTAPLSVVTRDMCAHDSVCPSVRLSHSLEGATCFNTSDSAFAQFGVIFSISACTKRSYCWTYHQTRKGPRLCVNSWVGWVMLTICMKSHKSMRSCYATTALVDHSYCATLTQKCFFVCVCVSNPLYVSLNQVSSFRLLIT